MKRRIWLDPGTRKSPRYQGQEVFDHLQVKGGLLAAWWGPHKARAQEVGQTWLHLEYGSHAVDTVISPDLLLKRVIFPQLYTKGQCWLSVFYWNSWCLSLLIAKKKFPQIFYFRSEFYHSFFSLVYQKPYQHGLSFFLIHKILIWFDRLSKIQRVVECSKRHK